MRLDSLNRYDPGVTSPLDLILQSLNLLATNNRRKLCFLVHLIQLLTLYVAVTLPCNGDELTVEFQGKMAI